MRREGAISSNDAAAAAAAGQVLDTLLTVDGIASYATQHPTDATGIPPACL